ncbi:MAG: hypothetical protein K2W85_10920 [Phycisphaerales bacterium]|nr:hypothetical protein [Phycisphaerales bacterium]
MKPMLAWLGCALLWLFLFLCASHLTRADGFGGRKNIKTAFSVWCWFMGWIGLIAIAILGGFVLRNKM